MNNEHRAHILKKPNGKLYLVDTITGEKSSDFDERLRRYETRDAYHYIVSQDNTTKEVILPKYNKN